MSEHPLLTFVLALIAANVATWPFKLVNRWIRHRNVVAAGWPPIYLDADGDKRTLDEDDIAALKAARPTVPPPGTEG
jgi:hypothetical protein